jgi:hypothetical protein
LRMRLAANGEILWVLGFVKAKRLADAWPPSPELGDSPWFSFPLSRA